MIKLNYLNESKITPKEGSGSSKMEQIKPTIFFTKTVFNASFIHNNL